MNDRIFRTMALGWSTGLALALSAGAQQVFQVSPSGDTSGDTDPRNIANALNAATAAGPGNTVQLAAGRFYLDRPVIAKNFSGTLQGAGMGVTIVESLPDASGSFPAVDNLDGIRPGYYPNQVGADFLFYSINGGPDQISLVFSDFTQEVTGPTSLHLDEGSPSVQRAGIWVWGKETGIQDFAVSKLNVTFQRHEVIGEVDPSFIAAFGVNGANVGGGDRFNGESAQQTPGLTFYFKPITGNYLYKDCRYTNVDGAAAFFGTIVNSKVTVDGISSVTTADPAVDNFVIFDAEAYVFGDFSGTTVEIKNSVFTNGALFAAQGVASVLGWHGTPVPGLAPTAPTSLLIHDNSFSMPGQAQAVNPSVFALDFTTFVGPETLDLDVSNNRFPTQVGNPAGFTPAIGGQFLNNAIIVNNTFTGASNWGAIAAFDADGWVIKANNDQNLNAPQSMYLDSTTSNFTVVGSGKDTVVDLGTNNVITGAARTTQGNVVGMAVSNAMQALKAARR